MSVSSIGSTIDPTSAQTATPTASSQKTLSQNDFLKLLTVQMQNQDPMKPMDDQSFMGQMAQFSTLQATTTMSTDMTALRSSTDLTTANALVGHQVTIVNKADGTVTGNVTGVDASTGSPEVIIAGKSYSLSDITSVLPAPTTATSTPTS